MTDMRLSETPTSQSLGTGSMSNELRGFVRPVRCWRVRELDTSPALSTSCPVWTMGKEVRPYGKQWMSVTAIQGRSERLRTAEFQEPEKQGMRTICSELVGQKDLGKGMTVSFE